MSHSRLRTSTRPYLWGLLAVVACQTPATTKQTTWDSLDGDTQAALRAMTRRPSLPADPTNPYADDPLVQHFGRFLAFDPRLSGSGRFSCTTCHDPAAGFGDGLALSEAAGVTTRHAPTLWNTAYQRWWYWDGRCDSLWCQATGPIEAPNEMDMDRVSLARLLVEEEDLHAAYLEVFGPLPDMSDASRFPDHARPNPASPEDPSHLAWEAMQPEDQEAVTAVLVRIAMAIAAWERTLVTADTRVDEYVAALESGDESRANTLLSTQETNGLMRFVDDGRCVLCHSGWSLSNLEFHTIGLPDVPTASYEDFGRYDGIGDLLENPFRADGPWSADPTGAAAQRLQYILPTSTTVGQFKTPGLREVAHSAPYMHGGHFDTLADVIDFYSEMPAYTGPGHREEILVTHNWSQTEKDELIAFLEAISEGGPEEPTAIVPPATPLP